jgi:hypothetical protein
MAEKMSKTTTAKGKCYICRKELGKGAMKNHLLKCNKLGEGKTNYFLIKVEDFYDKNYWLYIQVKAAATLADLDSFLRDIWLECCGHLSAFTINDISFDSNADSVMDSFWGQESEVMGDYKLKDVLAKDMVFKHEYDFGSTTTLKLTVADTYSGASTKDKVTLLARNNRLEYTCKKCGKKASYILPGDNFDEFTPLCEDCLADYEDEEGNLIKITNSPRMGVCGYCGENDVYELD